MQPFLVFTILAILTEWLFYAAFLQMPRASLLGRVVLINCMAGLSALVIALSQYLYGDWLFIHSWGARDIFLFTCIVEYPFAFVALPRLPFAKSFSLVVIGNLLSTLIALALLMAVPTAFGFPALTVQEAEAEAIRGGQRIHAALEKYRANHDGAVPLYIYGGDEGSWRGHDQPDRLLQEGLLESYPKNPLHLGRGYLRPRQVWGFWPLFFGTKSPEFRALRAAFEPLTGEHGDPRFGIKGIRMGNLLSDPLVPESSEHGEYRLNYEGKVLPGSFFYRAYDLTADGTPDSYVLGVLGAEGTAGIDIYDATADEFLTEGVNPEVASDGVPDCVIWVAGGGILYGFY